MGPINGCQLACNIYSVDVACKQALLTVTRVTDEEQSDLEGRSLAKRCQESEPTLITVIFSFLLRQSKVKSELSTFILPVKISWLTFLRFPGWK